MGLTKDESEPCQKLFNINCVPCHGTSGDGEGMIVQRGFPKPPPLFSAELIKAKAQHFYGVITRRACASRNSSPWRP
jgi:cytochrome c